MLQLDIGIDPYYARTSAIGGYPTWAEFVNIGSGALQLRHPCLCQSSSLVMRASHPMIPSGPRLDSSLFISIESIASRR